jgi:histidinol-phosphate aminotransferase
VTGFPTALVRPDLRDFAGYSSARTSATVPATIWLNANESAGPSLVDPEGRVRRYPEPQPAELVAALARYYAVDPSRVVVGRGSDEAIELLVRAACPPGGGQGIVVSSPTFGMYAVSARLHGVPVHDVPQQDLGETWRVDTGRLAEVAGREDARVVFLASPGNPTGSTVDRDDLAVLAYRLARQSLVVVDEAYQEYSDEPSATELLDRLPNLVVLRTLSKAQGLAGARVGVALAHPDLAAVLHRVQAPYPVPEPVTRLALAALSAEALTATRDRVDRTLAERDRLRAVLGACPLVRSTYRSSANFVLARCSDPDALLGRLAATGIQVRDLRHQPQLGDAVRVTVGTPEEIDAVAAALDVPPTPTPSPTLSTPRTA